MKLENVKILNGNEISRFLWQSFLEVSAQFDCLPFSSIQFCCFDFTPEFSMFDISPNVICIGFAWHGVWY